MTPALHAQSHLQFQHMHMVAYTQHTCTLYTTYMHIIHNIHAQYTQHCLVTVTVCSNTVMQADTQDTGNSKVESGTIQIIWVKVCQVASTCRPNLKQLVHMYQGQYVHLSSASAIPVACHLFLH